MSICHSAWAKATVSIVSASDHSISTAASAGAHQQNYIPFSGSQRAYACQQPHLHLLQKLLQSSASALRNLHLSSSSRLSTFSDMWQVFSGCTTTTASALHASATSTSILSEQQCSLSVSFNTVSISVSKPDSAQFQFGVDFSAVSASASVDRISFEDFGSDQSSISAALAARQQQQRQQHKQQQEQAVREGGDRRSFEFSHSFSTFADRAQGNPAASNKSDQQSDSSTTSPQQAIPHSNDAVQRSS
jgi:hypothetical protein